MKFGMGSQPTNDPDDYPPAEDVVRAMRERRQVLLDLLENTGESELSTPTPDGSPSFLPDLGAVFEMAAWHEALHAGQITIAHRALGNAPISGRTPQATV